MDKRPISPSILVVDDHPFVRRIIQQILVGLGYVGIATAESSEQALNMLARSRFDLVITDVEMGAINGLELIRRIRSKQSAAPADTRVIVLTTHAQRDVLGVAMALDVNGFMVKPVKPELVQAKIRAALSEALHLRPQLAYEEVRTSLGNEAEAAPAASRQAPAPAVPVREVPPNDEPAEMLEPSQLAVGMVLARDLHAADGTILLKKGHMLSESNIARILELRRILAAGTIAVVPAKSDANPDSREMNR